MFHLATALREHQAVLVSGGPDSMALLHFMAQGRKNPTAIFYNHGTQFSKECESLVSDFCDKHGIRLIVDKVVGQNEAEWASARNERNLYHSNLYGFQEFYTGHHLDDQVEWYIFQCLKGNPKTMPVATLWDNPMGSFWKVKPFSLTRKQELIDYCKRYNIPYAIDPTNLDGSNSRSKIRLIMPEIEAIRPGVFKAVAKLVKQGC
jgi:tRNA(Ile)-lysidine synthase